MAMHPASDHHDGKRFFNPTYRREPTLKDLLRFIIHFRPQKWPKDVQNQPDLHLHPWLEKQQAAITFVNHATVLIQLSGLNILTDPIWSARVSPLRWIGPKRVRQPGIAFSDLPKIHLVLVSHNHYDHMDKETIQRLEQTFSPLFLVAKGDAIKLQRWGCKRVVEMDWWQSHSFSDQTQITFTPGQHFSGRTPFDRNQSLWGGFMIRHYDRNIFFCGDAGYSPHFTEICRRLGPSSLAFLPIGAYEPRWFMRSVHMDPPEAVRAHIDLQAKQSIGIHFGTFQLTEEGIYQPIHDLKFALAEGRLPAQEFIVLPEGRTRIIELRRANEVHLESQNEESSASSWHRAHSNRLSHSPRY